MSSLKKGLFKTATGTFDKAQVHFTRCGVFFPSLLASAVPHHVVRCCFVVEEESRSATFHTNVVPSENAARLSSLRNEIAYQCDSRFPS